jgi:hypothetical protein
MWHCDSETKTNKAEGSHKSEEMRGVLMCRPTTSLLGNNTPVGVIWRVLFSCWSETCALWDVRPLLTVTGIIMHTSFDVPNDEEQDNGDHLAPECSSRLLLSVLSLHFYCDPTGSISVLYFELYWYLSSPLSCLPPECNTKILSLV